MAFASLRQPKISMAWRARSSALPRKPKPQHSGTSAASGSCRRRRAAMTSPYNGQAETAGAAKSAAKGAPQGNSTSQAFDQRRRQVAFGRGWQHDDDVL